MRLLTLLAPVIATLALSADSAAGAQPHDGAATAVAKQTATKKAKVKRTSCRRGYALRVVKVKRKGRTVRIRRCRRTGAARWSPLPAPKAPVAPAPAPGAPKPLFDPPGRTLELEEAEAYIERYLHDSRFTDCPAGWPSCGQPERRYSHFGDGKFVHCLLTPIPGLGTSFLSAYFYEPGTGTVQPDGSWSFEETVLDLGRPTFYHWDVTADGAVSGTFKRPGGEDPVPIGPLRYAAGARSCDT